MIETASLFFDCDWAIQLARCSITTMEIALLTLLTVAKLGIGRVIQGPVSGVSVTHPKRDRPVSEVTDSRVRAFILTIDG